MPAIKATFLEAGFCIQRERFSIRSGSIRKVQFPALCCLLQFEDAPPLLYDTGYGNSFLAQRGVAARLYAKLLNPRQSRHGSLSKQLADLGVSTFDPIDIAISHFHPDHIGGLRDFPEARFHCLEKTFRDVDQARFPFLSKGYLPGLLPERFKQRTTFYQFQKSLPNPLPEFGQEAVAELRGDPSLLAYSLDGHAKAQMGLLVRGTAQSLFLVADTAWSSLAIRNNELPSRLTAPIQDDWPALKRNLRNLRQLHQAQPQLLIAPSHCQEIAVGKPISLG